VEFIQANRFRMRVMQQLDTAMSGLDLFVGSRQLLTNRTGHPVVSVPSGFHRGMPTALHFTGQVLGEETILRLATAFQSVTDHHRKQPPGFA
jgi:Asp-tRNA(Asn)/Glu-tRNA(Gln) amidotransferase A subunit family amidase